MTMLTARIVAALLLWVSLCHASPVFAQDADGDKVVESPADRERRAAHVRDTLALADELAAQADARALALAAFLRATTLDGAAFAEGAQAYPPLDALAARWLSEAERRAPDDVAVLLMSLHQRGLDDPRHAALISRWRALEPDNLAPLMHARLSGHELFAAAASTTRFDLHYDDVIRAVIETLSRHPYPALKPLIARDAQESLASYAASLGSLLWVVSAMPPFQSVAKPCRGESLPATRRQQCRHIAQIMIENSDIHIAESLGYSILTRATDNAAEQSKGAEAKRVRDWLILRTGELATRDMAAFCAEFVRLIRDTPQITERALNERMLVDAGIDPTPSPGWQREDEPAPGL